VHYWHRRGLDPLHMAGDGEQGGAEQLAAVLLRGGAPDDDVDGAGLILRQSIRAAQNAGNSVSLPRRDSERAAPEVIDH